METIIKYGIIVSFISVIASIVAAIFFPVNPLYAVMLLVITGLLYVFTTRSNARESAFTVEQEERLAEIEKDFASLKNSVQVSSLVRR